MTSIKAQLLLTHGAGASCQSDFMQQLAVALRTQGIAVTLFNFDYMQTRLLNNSKRPPPRAALLVPELTQALSELKTALPLFVGGKSMGGRVASLWAAQQAKLHESSIERVQAVFAYGYPFHPPRKSSWRTEHFSRLKCPLHIIQGERDPFGNKTELSAMSWPAITIDWLSSADHDFKPLKSSGLSQATLITQAATLTSRYIDAAIAKNK